MDPGWAKGNGLYGAWDWHFMFYIFALGILVLPIIDDACCPCGLLSKRCVDIKGHQPESPLVVSLQAKTITVAGPQPSIQPLEKQYFAGRKSRCWPLLTNHSIRYSCKQL